MTGARPPSQAVRGPRLTWLSVLWIAVAAFSLGLFAAGIPVRQAQLLPVGAEQVDDVSLLTLERLSAEAVT